MGLVGHILTKEPTNCGDRVKNVVMEILKKFPCECHASETSGGYFISVVDNDDEYGCSMYTYNDPPAEYFDDIEDKDIYCALYIEKLNGNDKRLEMLLCLLYDYMKVFPDDIFYTVATGSYTKADIERIYESRGHEDWLAI